MSSFIKSCDSFSFVVWELSLGSSSTFSLAESPEGAVCGELKGRVYVPWCTLRAKHGGVTLHP